MGVGTIAFTAVLSGKLPGYKNTVLVIRKDQLKRRSYISYHRPWKWIMAGVASLFFFFNNTFIFYAIHFTSLVYTPTINLSKRHIIVTLV